MDNLVCAMLVPRTRLLLPGPITCPLGRITISGSIHHNPGIHRSTMRVYGQYAIVLVVEGAGTYADQRGTQPVRPGSLIFVFPDVPHAYGPGPGQFWNDIYISFDGPVFDLWRQRRLLDDRNPVWHLRPVRHWFRQIHRVVEPPIPADAALERICRLQQVLADAAAWQCRQSTATDAAWLAGAQRAVEKMHPGADWNAIAAETGMSYEGFRRRFRRAAGLSPARYRAQRQMEQAAHRLAQGWSNSQIAMALGMSDEFHFSRRFRQVMGIAPSQYRQRLAGR